MKSDSEFLEISGYLHWTAKCEEQNFQNESQIEKSTVQLKLILLPGSLRGQDPVHREEYMVGRISDCFESLIGAMEVSGHHDEACGLMERVLFADIGDIICLVDGLDIRFWDDALNSRAGRRLKAFRESTDF